MTKTDAMTFAVSWYFRYGARGFNYYDSLDEAINVEGYSSDEGQIALDCIEAWDDEGNYTRLSAEEVLDEHSRREDARIASAPTPPPVVASIYVRHPDGQWVHYSTFDDVERLNEVAGQFRRNLGAERVEIRDVRHD